MALLSDTAKLKRRRRNMVNLQMTVLSWCLEFFAGIITMIRIFVVTRNRRAFKYFVLFDVSFNFIIIPSSYLLNNDVNKSLIIAHGWCQTFRKTCGLSCTRKVEPAQADDIEVQNESNLVIRLIPSISGNIAALSQKNIQNLCDNAMNGFSACSIQENNPNLEEGDVVEELNLQSFNNPNILEESNFIEQVSALHIPRFRRPLPILQGVDSMFNDNDSDIEMITLSNEIKVSRQDSTNIQISKNIKKDNYVSSRL